MLATHNLLSRRMLGDALAHPVAGELDVAGLLGDVNSHEPLHHRLQLGIVHHLPLQRVEDLLADQRGHPQQRPLNASGSALMIIR